MHHNSLFLYYWLFKLFCPWYVSLSSLCLNICLYFCSFIAQIFKNRIIRFRNINVSKVLGIYWRRQWQPAPVLLPGNPMDGGAVHEVIKSRTLLSNLAFTFHFHALEKEMATHSSVLAWRIPGAKPVGLLSMGLHRVWHNWPDLAVAAAAGIYCQESF